MGLDDDLVNSAQDRRVQRVIKVTDLCIVAVHSQQVLGQVITADRKEIHALRHGRHLVDSRWHFNHDTDFRVGGLLTLLDQRFVRTPHQSNGLVNFTDTADHG